MGILGKEKGYIYIFDRNGLDFRVFEVTFNERLFRRFIKRAEKVIEAVEDLERGVPKVDIHRRQQDVGLQPLSIQTHMRRDR